ncbi:MAG: NTPase [Candidatus Bipolaricaulota bacterium]|nr:NTPase [Candidatus Bipolaricaulota bacterium]MCX7844284.1 NTPase [Candidatus Bipolaricaulota bacterium]MDW8151905.1 NTPase [Candidatus Bipolaricaulota bacterium]
MKVGVTGHPGVGKTTLVKRVLAAVPLRAGGMITEEIRKCGYRVGFLLRDVATGREGLLAHRHHCDGPEFGKYRLCLRDLEEIGAAAIERALEEAELIVIDEVGPMELKSPRFIAAVEKALACPKPLLVTVHRASNHHLAYRIRHEVDHLVRLTQSNREAKIQEVIQLFSRLSTPDPAAHRTCGKTP